MSLSLARKTLAGVAIAVAASLLAVLVATSPALGQSSAQQDQYTDGEQQTIRGYITSITGDTVLVEKDLDDPLPGPGNPKGSLSVTGDTEILKQSDGELVEAERSDLEVGQLVEATYSGPVAESYPFQASADRIVILEDSSGDGGDQYGSGDDQYDNGDGQRDNGGDQRGGDSGGGDSGDGDLNVLPDTGGLPLVGLGGGVLLVAGGLVLRRLWR